MNLWDPSAGPDTVSRRICQLQVACQFDLVVQIRDRPVADLIGASNTQVTFGTTTAVTYESWKRVIDCIVHLSLTHELIDLYEVERDCALIAQK